MQDVRERCGGLPSRGSRWVRRPLLLGALLCTGPLSGCERTVVSVVEVATVEISPSRIILMEGEHASASAVLRESEGRELSGRAVEWYTADPRVATATAAGRIEGHGEGSTLVFAVSEGVQGSAEVSVLSIPPPRIELSPTSVSLAGLAGSPGVMTRTIGITNAGEGRLWGLTVLIVHPEGASSGWLAAELDRTQAPATVVLRATALDLAEGVHEAELLITSPAASNSPQSVSIRMIVGNPPPPAT